MHPWQERLQALTRRELFQHVGCGIGGAALAALLTDDGRAAPATATQPLRTHFAPRAKNVIYLHMVGAPSHLELFEPKPELTARNGEPIPKSFTEGKRFAFIQGELKLMGSRFKYQPSGKSGLPISELLPNLQKVADELCIVKTLHTEEFNHGPAQLFMQTGSGRFGRPSFGAWTTYGLGSENENLPSFVVLITGKSLGLRLLADDASRDRIPHERRSGFVPLEPGRTHGRRSRANDRRLGAVESRAVGRRRRPGDRHADRAV